MKNIMKRAFALLLATVMLCLLASCGGIEDRSSSLVATGTVYTEGTQEIIVEAREEWDEPAGAFKSTITKDDIALEGPIAQKTVKSVTWVSAEEIKVVLEGKVTESNLNQFNFIIVKKSGMEGTTACDCTVSLFKTHLFLESSGTVNKNGLITHTYTYVMPLTEYAIREEYVNGDYIRDTEGAIQSVSYENGKIVIVMGSSSENNRITFAPEVTTYGKTATGAPGTRYAEFQ